MDERMKYFIFNKKSDYLRGYLEHMTICSGGICMEEETNQKGMFLSRVLDSQEEEMNWHRLQIQGNDSQEGIFKVSVYASNEAVIYYKNQEVFIGDFIHNKEIDIQEKCSYIEPFLQKQVVSIDDILLHEVTGRYLWILIEMYQQRVPIVFHDIKVSFPKQTWIEYMPEIYQKEDTNGFLQRYLGIFQTLYEDLNEQIYGVAQNLDMETADREYLEWLAGWLDIDDSYIWSEKQLRELLKNAVSLYKRRGTRQGLIDFITLYTGETPFVVENHQLNLLLNNRERYEKMCSLYGGSSYSFSVLVREEVLHSLQEQKTLIKIIEDVKPAHTELELVIIKPYLFLDKYSYLGINSVMGRYTNMVLDGQAVMPLAVLGQSVTLEDRSKDEEA